MNNKIFIYFLFILGGIPLLIYPFVLFANVMQIGGDYSQQSVFHIVMMYIFILITTEYPLTYFLCLVMYKSQKNKYKLLAVVPIFQLAVTVVIFYTLIVAEQ